MGFGEEEHVIMCQFKIQEDEVIMPYEMLLTQVAISCHLMKKDFECPLKWHCILLDSCSTTWKTWKESTHKFLQGRRTCKNFGSSRSG